LGKIISRGVDDLVRMSIREKIRTMSLPTKMKHLLANAGPHSKVHYPAFSFDRGRLDELDKSRHAIIHGEGVTLHINSRDSQEFFFNLTIYAGLVISSMLGLGISYPGFYNDWVQHLLMQAKGDLAGPDREPEVDARARA
jgi:hypothetical protein